MPGNYEIIQSQLPLVGGLGGHNLIVVKDPGGRVISEFNGLATSSDGVIKPIGYLSSDKLKVFEFTNANYYDSSQNQYTVYSTSSFSEISSRLNAMKQTMNQMNSLDMSYPFLGLGKNSNSVSSTLLASIGATESKVPNSAWVMPGVGDMLLPQSFIDSVRTSNGINTSFNSYFDTGTMFDNYWSTPSYGDAVGNFNMN